MIGARTREQQRAMRKRKGFFVLTGSVMMGTFAVAQETGPLVLATSYSNSESLRYVYQLVRIAQALSVTLSLSLTLSHSHAAPARLPGLRRSGSCRAGCIQ